MVESASQIAGWSDQAAGAEQAGLKGLGAAVGLSALRGAAPDAWNTEQDAVVLAHRQLTARELGMMLGRTETAVKRWRAKLTARGAGRCLTTATARPCRGIWPARSPAPASTRRCPEPRCERRSGRRSPTGVATCAMTGRARLGGVPAAAGAGGVPVGRAGAGAGVVPGLPDHRSPPDPSTPSPDRRYGSRWRSAGGGGGGSGSAGPGPARATEPSCGQSAPAGHSRTGTHRTGWGRSVGPCPHHTPSCVDAPDTTISLHYRKTPVPRWSPRSRTSRRAGPSVRRSG